MTRDQINAELERHITTFDGDQNYFDGYHDGLKWMRDVAPERAAKVPFEFERGNTQYREGFLIACTWCYIAIKREESQS